MRRLTVAIALALAASASLAAQLGGRPAEEWIKTLDGTTRVSSLKIDEVVAAMKLQPGQTVADIGAGSGLLSVPVAKTVGPKGRVYSVEIDAGFFPAIQKRAADNGLANIQTVLGTFTDPKLPVARIDLAFFHDVLHHIQDRGPYLKTLSKYLSRTGRIFVVDFEGGQGPHAQQADLQVSREQLTGWMTEAGFVQTADAKLFRDKYVLTFSRK
ncbi:MAG TPA: methyltransferase domain-containing protein [Vicinamibacterales bacterium]|nr:methyltransferase domain-containing protein [Vicinamibacterales bacterium]